MWDRTAGTGKTGERKWEGNAFTNVPTIVTIRQTNNMLKYNTHIHTEWL